MLLIGLLLLLVGFVAGLLFAVTSTDLFASSLPVPASDEPSWSESDTVR